MLSSKGYTQYGGIRAADDNQAASAGQTIPTTGKSPAETSGKGNGQFGRNNYTSIFGTPSMTSPFMVSFNGHQMSFNITFRAERLENTPEFVGVEPSTFTLDNKGYQPMKLEATAVASLGWDMVTAYTHDLALLEASTWDTSPAPACSADAYRYRGLTPDEAQPGRVSAARRYLQRAMRAGANPALVRLSARWVIAGRRTRPRPRSRMADTNERRYRGP